jgi:hypothetical protein
MISGTASLNSEQVTLLKISVGMTEIVEGETNDEKEIHFKSSSGSLSRMSFASSPHVVAVNILYRSYAFHYMD